MKISRVLKRQSSISRVTCDKAKVAQPNTLLKYEYVLVTIT